MNERMHGWVTSLTAKYVALFAVLVAVPVIATSAYFLNSSYQDNKKALIRVQQERAHSLAASVGQSLNGIVDRLRSIHGEGLTPGRLEPALRPILLTNPQPLDVFYVDRNGRVVVTVGASNDDSSRRLERPSIPKPNLETARNDVFFSRLYNLDDPESGATPALTVATYEAYGNGVVGERLYAGIFQQLIAETRVGEAGYAYAVDAGGRAITYPAGVSERRDPTSYQQTLPPKVRLSSLPQVRRALRSSAKSGSTVGHTFSSRKVLTAWATVEPTGWRVFVEQPESAAFAPLRGKIWRTALLLAAFVAAAVLLSFWLARRLVRPIRRMRMAAARIGAGAYDERIEVEPPRTIALRRRTFVADDRNTGVPTHHEQAKTIELEQRIAERRRQDDLGALADDLNRMAASLQVSHSQLEQKVEERTRELQSALEELARKSRELEIASQHKSDFLANMSHELRTPLNAIAGFSQVLREKLFGEINEKQEEYLDDILSSANHLLSLINDILDLSKVEAGQVELDVATFSLREALERGIVMVREKAMKNGVALNVELDPSVDLLDGDERRVRQVVFNLLSNAVKFTPQGGRVGVSSVRDNGDVKIAVEDSGPGIAARDQERIFEEFQQARVGSDDRPEGTGLGLALSRKLVELHGGRIWVESVLGEGSTFTFTLPLGSS